MIAPLPALERFLGFYSNLFTFPKKEGVNLILYLEALNYFVKVGRFKFESLRSVVATLHYGDFQSDSATPVA